tara:strand:- start:522 stop:722 length:201 start_codon:yes stop_codon:yes gene_type:complete
MNKYKIMTKALDEWSITREVLWDSLKKRVIFLTDETTDLSKIDVNYVVAYTSYADWAGKFMNGGLR